MGFLDISEYMRRLLALTEQVLISVENLLDDSVRRGLVNFSVTTRLVNDHQMSLAEVFVNVIGIIGRCICGVSVPDSAELSRAVRIGKHFQNLSEVVVSP